MLVPEHSQPSDDELASRIRQGDERAFEAMFTTYYQPLCDFVGAYLQAPDAADEVVQNVFLAIWAGRTTWNPAGVRAYLFGACRNRALSYQRHERSVARFEQRVVQERLATGQGALAPSPEEDLHASELRGAFRRAVHDLPERRRAVVILRCEHHFTYDEIARALGITVHTVEKHFSRAMAVLRRQLNAFRR